MLILDKLKVQLSSSHFSLKDKKLIRISVGNVVKHSQQPAKVLSQKALQWNQSIQLPLLYDKDFSFQIYDKHNFGYDQSQLQNIYSGTFQIISPDESRNSWEIFDSNLNKIGFLSSDIKFTTKGSLSPLIKSVIQNSSRLSNNNKSIKNNESAIVNNEGKVLRVNSIVARVTGSRFKKGFVIIQIGDRKIQTHPVKSRSGELVFIESQQIDYFESDTQALVKIYSIDSHDVSELVAQGTMILTPPRPPRGISLTKDGFEAGQVLIQSKITDKNKAKTNISKIFNQNNSLYEQSYMNHNKKAVSASRSINFSRLQDFGIQHHTSRVRPFGIDSSINSMSPSSKKVSVVQGNKNIVFPKQKRFMSYQDRQNERISYLRDRSFQFKSPETGKYYRGAGLGYGGKTDFAKQKQSVPGVGNYKLPSIWDRY